MTIEVDTPEGKIVWKNGELSGDMLPLTRIEYIPSQRSWGVPPKIRSIRAIKRIDAFRDIIRFLYPDATIKAIDDDNKVTYIK